MTERNLKYINILGFNQYIEFLRSALGFKAFTNNDVFIKITTPKNIKEIKKYIGEYSRKEKKSSIALLVMTLIIKFFVIVII